MNTPEILGKGPRRALISARWQPHAGSPMIDAHGGAGIACSATQAGLNRTEVMQGRAGQQAFRVSPAPDQQLAREPEPS